MMDALEIAAIREMFPDQELYYIKIQYDEFVIRTITPSEYYTIKELAKSKFDIDDLVTQTAIIYPSMYMVNEGPAGIPEQLSNAILKFSMLSEDSHEDIRNRYYYYMNVLNSEEGLDFQIPIVIKMAFPEFTFEQIERWSMDERLKNLARALFALNLKGIPIDFDIPETTVEEPESFEELEAKLEANGLDPVSELYPLYKTKPHMIDNPFLGGTYWDNEVIIDAIRKQIWKRI